MTKPANFLRIIFCVYFLSSCQSNNNTGPCDYSEEKFEMLIVDILEDKEDDNHLIVLVDFSGDTPYSQETWNLEDIRNVKTTLKFVQQNNVKPGSIYSGTIYNKIENSGSCEEEFIDWDQSFK